MRQVVTLQPQQMALRAALDPEPAPGEALIRVEAVGMCGSDLHLFLGEHPYSRFPMVQGHEFSGTVIEFGDGYDGDIRPGDRVAVEPLVACGRCYPCRRERPNCCVELEIIGVHLPGALQDYITVPFKLLYPVGDLEPQLAALVEPISIGYQAIERAQVEPGEQVVIYGAGPIGQAVLLSALQRGGRVLVADLIMSRLELARDLGAETVVQSSNQNLTKVIAEWTEGEGPAVAVDATGVPEVTRGAFDHVAASGRIVIVGTSTRALSVSMNEYIRKELTVLGSRNNAGVFGNAVDLVHKNREILRRLISHTFALEETESAIHLALRNPEATAKVMIAMAP